MLDLLPRRAFFRFEFPLHYQRAPLKLDGELKKWGRKHLLPPLAALEGQEPFADVYMAWNEDWFYAAFDVPQRRGPLVCDASQWWKKDGLRLCIDTRDAREIKRATRFCHFFYILPTGGHGRKQPVVGVHRMSHAKEPPPAVDVSLIQVGAHVTRGGYSLEVGIPAGCLNGWDPAEHARIGLYYKIKDTTLGEQHLSATDELGWNADPSTWATGVLTR